jgi:hypothetical protein
LTANISSSQGIALAGQTVQFKVKKDGATVATVLGSGTTDSRGVATLNHTFDAAQSAQVIAELSGSTVFNDASSSEILISVSASLSSSSLKSSLDQVLSFRLPRTRAP